ncbi:putative DCC family thiol-disulfide oxidoreductase YuxK [Geodermatophilus bullaregiensis]|uniref:thiol-disulfide oxidoreductase DCC family protein n=1 Tax=Geodermatophilus bullaregiensis TaxID=1564160 RepID=UPI0019588B15|nr:DCC1-like thiol-disulfide oxidoreductase family protein [Geodermatophilus bullaregiensis]MBM7806504.1 putative DCC family thiol-disulfide oxidoreductase YuxK [Geodermatophilus bullaregiensis]
MQRPALVFDGDCGFCTRSAALARRVLPAGCAVVPWQGADLAAVGTTAARARREVLWVPPVGEVLGGAPAVAAALRAAGSGWALLGRVLQLRPVAPLAGVVYRVVAANRMRLPGSTTACALPTTSDAGTERGDAPPVLRHDRAV